MAAQADGLAALLRSLHMRPQVPPQLPGHVRHACTSTALKRRFRRAQRGWSWARRVCVARSPSCGTVLCAACWACTTLHCAACCARTLFESIWGTSGSIAAGRMRCERCKPRSTRRT